MEDHIPIAILALNESRGKEDICCVEIEVTVIDFKDFKSRLLTYRNLDTLRHAHVDGQAFDEAGDCADLQFISIWCTPCCEGQPSEVSSFSVINALFAAGYLTTRRCPLQTRYHHKLPIESVRS